jgi:ketosteroid isomerase-like protein
MSGQNAEVVYALQASFNDRGIDGMVEHFDPNILHRAIEGAVDDVGEMHGVDAVRRYYQDWIDMFDDLTTEIDEVRDAGDDRVVARLRTHGRAKLSGIATEIPYAVVYRVRDGLIVESREYAEFEQALAAAGLSP